MKFFWRGRIFEVVERAVAKTMHGRAPQGAPWHKSRCSILDKGHLAMTKTIEVISEAVRNPKHPFRKVDNRPKKPMKHRYERRKIREYIHLAHWGAGELA